MSPPVRGYSANEKGLEEKAPQVPRLYSDTLAQNILLGIPAGRERLDELHASRDEMRRL